VLITFLTSIQVYRDEIVQIVAENNLLRLAPMTRKKVFKNTFIQAIIPLAINLPASLFKSQTLCILIENVVREKQEKT
jgi:hypothetical protein